ncbi:MAG: bacteriaohemerythrin [Proteobacteria bacterium]|nr:bacteriaohemerythrin [Pseudomonadota bacterium]
MSGHLRWDPCVRIGVEEIDLEHQTFVVLINQLDHYLQQPEMAERILQALAKYVAFHFQSEENMMFAAAYPGLEAHRRIHLSLLEQLNNVLLKLRGGESSYAETLEFLRQWYCSHTSVEDMKFGEFLKNQP